MSSFKGGKFILSLSAAACLFGTTGAWAAEPTWNHTLNQGLDAIDKKDFVTGKAKLEESLDIAQKANDTKKAVTSMLELSNMYHTQDKLDEALKYAKRATDASDKGLPNDHVLLSKGLKEVADLYFVCGNQKEAQSLYAQIQEFKDKYPEEFSKKNEQKEPDPDSVADRAYGRVQRNSRKSCYVANPKAPADAPALAILFSGPVVPVKSDTLTAALRAYDPSMSKALAEVDPKYTQGTLAIIGWGDHVIRAMGANRPMAAELVVRSADNSHLTKPDKDKILGNKSHLVLYYVGYDTRPLEQWTALAAVAGALEAKGAVGVLSGHTQTVIPAREVAAAKIKKGSLALLRSGEVAKLYTEQE